MIDAGADWVPLIIYSHSDSEASPWGYIGESDSDSDSDPAPVPIVPAVPAPMSFPARRPCQVRCRFQPDSDEARKAKGAYGFPGAGSGAHRKHLVARCCLWN